MYMHVPHAVTCSYMHVYLSYKDICHTVRTVKFGHSLGRVPALLVDVHQNSLLGLASIHKLILCLGILAL